MKRILAFLFVLATILVLATSTAFATDVVNPYSDVAEETENYDAIMWCYSKHIMVGRGDGRFYPDDSISRAEFAQVLYNTLCTCPDTYVSGCTRPHFGPLCPYDSECTRVQFGHLYYNPSLTFMGPFFDDIPDEHWSRYAALFIVRYTGAKFDSVPAAEFDAVVFHGDSPIDGPTACEWIAAFGGTCSCEATSLTRAEAAAMIMDAVCG